jgi:hypothetical protein
LYCVSRHLRIERSDGYRYRTDLVESGPGIIVIYLFPGFVRGHSLKYLGKVMLCFISGHAPYIVVVVV